MATPYGNTTPCLEELRKGERIGVIIRRTDAQRAQRKLDLQAKQAKLQAEIDAIESPVRVMSRAALKAFRAQTILRIGLRTPAYVELEDEHA